MKPANTSRIINVLILLSLGLAGSFIFPKAGSLVADALVPGPARELPRSEVKESPTIKLYFTGDLMLDRNVANRMKGKPLNFLLGEYASSSRLLEYDIVSANLEGAVTRGGEHLPPHNLYDFAFEPGRIEEAKALGFDYFAIANNHVSDQGETGLGDTREQLRSLGLSFSGDSDARVSSSSVTYLEIQGKRFALVSVSQVYNELPKEKLLALVAEANAQADIVVVNIHWGTEYQHVAGAMQRSLGHDLVDSGADLVIGHHPHVVQGMEIYKDVPIFYSLGNFVFDQYFSKDTQEGLTLSVKMKENELSIDLLPHKLPKSSPSLMAGEEKVRFLGDLAGWSDVSEELKTQIKAGKINIANSL